MTMIVGGRENFFHCKKYGSCYSIGLQNNHSCVENSMRHHCPICYDYLFDSLKATTVMKCGRTMHCECLTEMLKHDKYCCPICSRSVIDMSRTWKRLDEEIEATIMPKDYRYKKVCILCNDTTKTSSVKNVVTAIRTIRQQSLVLYFPGDCSIPKPEHRTRSTPKISGY